MPPVAHMHWEVTYINHPGISSVARVITILSALFHFLFYKQCFSAVLMAFVIIKNALLLLFTALWPYHYWAVPVRSVYCCWRKLLKTSGLPLTLDDTLYCLMHLQMQLFARNLDSRQNIFQYYFCDICTMMLKYIFSLLKGSRKNA